MGKATGGLVQHGFGKKAGYGGNPNSCAFNLV
mgnify:CR=1 FL=1